jgi:chromosome segregation ATPase
LMRNYEKLLAKVRDLEADKRRLEERLAASEGQQRLQQEAVRDTDRLVDRAEKLLARVKDLEEKLAASEAQRQQAQQDADRWVKDYGKLVSEMKNVEAEKRQLEGKMVDAKEMSTLKELRSTVARVLKDSETTRTA